MDNRNRRKNYMIIIIGIGAILIMFFVENYIKPIYLYKSIIKLAVFLGSICFYSCFSKETIFTKIFKRNYSKFKLSLELAIVICIIIIIVYFNFENLIDFSKIQRNLEIKEQVNESNYIFVFTYIAVVNSFIEELFFRGFLFLQLSTVRNDKFPLYFSSLSFALYHIGIISGWFNFGIFTLGLIVLYFVGYIFNRLCEKSRSILSSWIIHASANLTINVIGGFVLF